MKPYINNHRYSTLAEDAIAMVALVLIVFGAFIVAPAFIGPADVSIETEASE